MMRVLVGPCALLALLALLAACGRGPTARAAHVSGSCPPPVALRQCSPTCQDHAECPGAMLCCGTVCGGTACVRAVTDVRVKQQDADDETSCCPKRGSCPAVVEGDWQCSSRCRGDFDCDGPAKCCPTRCGAWDCAAALPSP